MLACRSIDTQCFIETIESAAALCGGFAGPCIAPPVLASTGVPLHLIRGLQPVLAWFLTAHNDPEKVQSYNTAQVLQRHQFRVISSVLSCLYALYKCTLYTSQPT